MPPPHCPKLVFTVSNPVTKVQSMSMSVGMLSMCPHKGAFRSEFPRNVKIPGVSLYASSMLESSPEVMVSKIVMSYLRFEMEG